MEIKIKGDRVNLGYIADELNDRLGDDNRSIIISEAGETGLMRNDRIGAWEHGPHCLSYDMADMGVQGLAGWDAGAVRQYLDDWARDAGYQLVW